MLSVFKASGCSRSSNLPVPVIDRQVTYKDKNLLTQVTTYLFVYFPWLLKRIFRAEKMTQQV